MKRHRDPEHAACRALRAMGITGRALFVHKDSGMPGLSMNIERAADFATVEDAKSGLRTIRYVPFARDGVTPPASDEEFGTDIAERSFSAPGDGVADAVSEKRAEIGS